MKPYSIALARPQDLPQLAAIELAAAQLLAAHAPASVLLETSNLDDLREAQARGRLWVALAGDEPVGFAHVKVLEPGVAHLEELDVHPAHGRRGLGSALVRAVCAWASREGFESVTLTTFRDVPFNQPFYAGLGFTDVATADLTPVFREGMQDEARRGLDPARRVVMRCALQRAGNIPAASRY
ncbi:MAG TPA: GNAT family N-acetyltransferase [Vicinamibacterales bacterium]|nr:GNAT family N-acetyltransferase [Vicinamibacterales bacterium]